MTPRHLGSVLITDLGLWFVVRAVTSLASLPYDALSSSPTAAAFLHTLAGPALMESTILGIAGTLLIVVRETLSRRFFPGDSAVALCANRLPTAVRQRQLCRSRRQN
jgi:hypothetical protein